MGNMAFIDTPGSLPLSTNNVERNERIMLFVKRVIRKSPSDIVLYVLTLSILVIVTSRL